MSPDKWKRLEEIFNQAVVLSPEKRKNFLDEACRDDRELREQAENLLANDSEAEDFIESSPYVSYLEDVVEERESEIDAYVGRKVGAFRLVREIGRGGMGAVFLAERDDKEFRQKVAVKLIKRGMDSEQVLRRFRNERQILAALNHPNIAKLLDGGTTEDGLPYFVMEYIEGLPVTQFCDSNRLTVRQRLDLFQKVCAAVYYAHQNLIIHRDIKPSNILVTEDGTPKLLDFGIAKLLNPDLIHETQEPTATAMRMMTPEYASPEQVSGDFVTSATDQYSLGVLLYELLTGHRPYKINNRSPLEIARVICEKNPVPPSEVIEDSERLINSNKFSLEPVTIETIVQNRQTTVDILKTELSGSLDAILLQTLNKKPHHRYSSVNEFTLDIERFLQGRAIKARPVSPHVTHTDTGEVQTGQKTLAILPFKLLNLTANGSHRDTGDEFLGIGLADALITRLGNMRRFSVRPTSSVLQFAESNEDSLTIGKRLGVAYVLDGRILKVRDKIRVTVQLISIKDGASIWAEQFDEKLADVLALQDSLSTKVAEAIIPQISSEELQQLSFVGTNSKEAHEKYLRGRFYWHKFSEDALARAIVYFYEAIAIDPTYARAYSGVADYHTLLGMVGVLPPKECFEAAKDAAERAIEIDPNLGEAYASLAFAGWAYDWDFNKAEELFRKAARLNPNYSQTHEWLALFYSSAGRFDEALTEINTALRLNPTSASISLIASFVFFKSRRFEEALAQNRHAIELEPENGLALRCFAWILPELDRAGEAVEYSQRAVEISRSPMALSSLGYVYAKTGQAAKAEKILHELRERTEKNYVSPFYLALMETALGEKVDAVRHLKQSAEEKDYRVFWLESDARFDALRREKDFTELVESLRKFKGADLLVTQTAADKTVGSTDSDAIHKTAITQRFSANFEKSVGSEEKTKEQPLPRRKWSRAWLALPVALIFAGLFALWHFDFHPFRMNVAPAEENASQEFIAGKVTPLTNVNLVEKNPKLSPDKSKVLFVSNRDGNNELYVMNFDGSGLRRLTNNKTEEVNANWSPDGTRIVFESVSQMGVESDVWIMNADGSNQQNLTNYPGMDMRPIFSPDGTRIAFGSNRDLADRRESNIWVMNTDGTNLKQLTTGPEFESDPNWSPDGARIAYTKSMSGSVFDIWVMNADGTNQTNLTNTEKSDEALPVFSPDGTKIVYSTNFESFSPRYDLWIMNASDGGDRRRVTSHPANDLEAVWISDTKIIFQSNRSEIYKIYQTDINDTELPANLRAKEQNSIAVLPFSLVNLDSADEPLSLGLAEALSSRLGQTKRLTVRPVTTNTKVPASAEEALNIARDMNVNFVLFARLEKSGESLTAEASLQNTEKNETVWAEKFSVKANEIASLQNIIAERVAQNLSLELSIVERQNLNKKFTENDEAYQLYLAGRYYMSKRKPDDFKIAIKNFEQSVRLDPNFALGYAGIAEVSAIQNLYEIPPPPDAYSKAKKNAQKALEIDENLANAHAVLGYVKFYRERDRAGAEADFRRAIEINPSYSTAHHWYALALAFMGRPAEAAEQAETAERLDPRSLIIKIATGMVYMFDGQYDKSLAECDRALAVDSGFVPAYKVKRWVYQMTGNYEAARTAFINERSFSGSGDAPGWVIIQSQVEAMNATLDRAGIVEKLNSAIANPDVKNNSETFAYETALAYNALGETEKAFEWLEKTDKAKSHSFVFIKVDPRLNNLRSDPRFAELLQRWEAIDKLP